MPRSKGPVPRRLTEEARAAREWDMEGDAADAHREGHVEAEAPLADLVDDAGASSGSEGFVPWEEERESKRPRRKKKSSSSSPSKSSVPSQAAKKAAGKRRREAVAAKVRGLEEMAEAAEFYFSVPLRVSQDKKEGGGGVLGALGRFSLPLAEGEVLPEQGFWDEGEEVFVYLSSVPGMDFVLLQRFVQDEAAETTKDFLSRRRRGADPDDLATVRLAPVAPETRSLLECFAPGVGARRRGCVLMLESLTVEKGMAVRAVATEGTIFAPVHPSEVQAPPVPVSVKRTLNHFFGFALEEEEGGGGGSAANVRPDIDELYEVVKRFHQRTAAELDPLDPQHQSLLPTLRPYQKLSVRWMLSKEKLDKKRKEEEKPEMHVLYREVKTMEGETLYYNSGAGFLVKDRPLADPRAPGGILADEMGLGKTVEVLSLMLCHHRTEGLSKPEWQEPVKVKEKKRKKLRRNRREPSPVEFLLNTPEGGGEPEKDEPEETKKEKEEDAKEVSLGEEEEEILDDNYQITESEAETSPTKAEESKNEEDATKIKPADESREDPEIVQLDGNDDDSEDDDTSDEEYVPRPSSSRKRERPGHTSSTSEDSEHDELEQYVPWSELHPKKGNRERRQRRAAAGTASSSNSQEVTPGESNAPPRSLAGGRKKTAKRVRFSIPSEDEEEENVEGGDDGDSDYEPQPSTSRGTGRSAVSTSSRQRAKGHKTDVFRRSVPRAKKTLSKDNKKAKVINTDVEDKFDPASVLQNRPSVTAKSPMSDIVLYSIVSVGKEPGRKVRDGVSLHAIKKFISLNFGKSSPQHGKMAAKALASLSETGLLVNVTHGKRGSNGSFKVNPDFESFDTRGVAEGRELDAVESVIEKVITEHCYGGRPYDREEVEARLSRHKVERPLTLLQKMEAMYQRDLEEMSEAHHKAQARR